MYEHTAEQSAALRAELTDDPEARGYSGLSDAEAAVALGDRVSTATRPVPIVELESLCFRRGVMPRIYAAEASQVPEAVALARTVLRLFASRLEVVYTDDPATGATFDAMQAAAIMTADDRAAAEALAATPASRAEVLFGPGTTIAYWDVARARALEN